MLVNLHLICLLIKLQTPQPAPHNSLLTPPTCHCPLSSHRNPVAIADNNFNLGQLQLQLEVGRAKRNESILAVRRFFFSSGFRCCCCCCCCSVRSLVKRKVLPISQQTSNNNSSSSNDKTTPTTRAIHFLMMHIKNIRKKRLFHFSICNIYFSSPLTLTANNKK